MDKKNLEFHEEQLNIFVELVKTKNWSVLSDYWNTTPGYENKLKRGIKILKNSPLTPYITIATEAQNLLDSINYQQVKQKEGSKSPPVAPPPVTSPPVTSSPSTSPPVTSPPVTSPTKDTQIKEASEYATQATSHDEVARKLTNDASKLTNDARKLTNDASKLTNDARNLTNDANIRKRLAIENYTKAVQILLPLKKGENKIEEYLDRIEELRLTYQQGGSKRRKRTRRKTKKPKKTKRRKKTKKKKTKSRKRTKSRR